MITAARVTSIHLDVRGHGHPLASYICGACRTFMREIRYDATRRRFEIWVHCATCAHNRLHALAPR